MAEDFADEIAKRAASSARRSAVVALMCVIVLVLVLVIDNQIKRDLVKKVAEARGIVDNFAWQAGGAEDGRPAAQPARAADVAGSDPGDGVVSAAAAGPDVDTAPGSDGHEAASGRGGFTRGPGRDEG